MHHAARDMVALSGTTTVQRAETMPFMTRLQLPVVIFTTIIDRLDMFEPHLENHRQPDDGDMERDRSGTLLEELDKLAPIRSFDAFPKVQSSYTVRSRRGGVLTAVVGLIIFLLVLVSNNSEGAADRAQNDLGEYLYGSTSMAVKVDPTIESNLQLNVDVTVAMPCRCKPAILLRQVLMLMYRSSLRRFTRQRRRSCTLGQRFRKRRYRVRDREGGLEEVSSAT